MSALRPAGPEAPMTGSLGNIETFTAPLAGNSERIDTIMSQADGVMTKADAAMSGVDRLAGGKHGGELLQAVTSIRERAESFDTRSGALMADGRRTLGDVSQAVNNHDKNPTRLLFGASSNSACNCTATRKKEAGWERQQDSPLSRFRLIKTSLAIYPGWDGREAEPAGLLVC